MVELFLVLFFWGKGFFYLHLPSHYESSGITDVYLVVGLTWILGIQTQILILGQMLLPVEPVIFSSAPFLGF